MTKLLLIFLLLSFPAYGALVDGVNSGFVTTAPVADPDGSADTQIDTLAFSMKVTSPADMTTITAMGAYISTNPGNTPDFELGIYTHDAGNDRPDALVGSSTAGALSAGVGWKTKAGLSIALAPNTIYWLCMQCDNDAGGATRLDRDSAGTPKRDYKTSQTALPSPWGVSSGSFTGLLAIYAFYTTATTRGKMIMIY